MLPPARDRRRARFAGTGLTESNGRWYYRSCLTEETQQEPPELADAFAVVPASLSLQQVAAHDSAPVAQQSHSHGAQPQTPVSQQHPPSGQQVGHAQSAVAPAVGATAFSEQHVPEVLFDQLAPKANPKPANINKPSAANNFMVLTF